ncbi:hypothetical protein AB2S56_016205 [Haloparvum sp. AD34]
MARGFVTRDSDRWALRTAGTVEILLVWTTSKDHGYRYFCFAFARTRCKIWKFVTCSSSSLEDDHLPRKRHVSVLTGNDDVGLDLQLRHAVFEQDSRVSVLSPW